MVNMVNIIPAKHQHVSIVIVSTLAFNLKPQYSLTKLQTLGLNDEHTDGDTSTYFVPEGLAACSSAETVGGSFADFVVGVDLQGGQSLERASQWEELCDAPPPQLI